MSEDASYADMNGNEESKPRITGIRSVNNLYKLPMGEGAFVNKVIICCECKKELATGLKKYQIFEPVCDDCTAIKTDIGFRFRRPCVDISKDSSYLGRFESMTDADQQFLRDCGIQTDEKEKQ